jgi:hypothetical protein
MAEGYTMNMRVLKVIVLGVIGLFLGYGLGVGILSGYFQRWEKQEMTPQEIEEIFTVESLEDISYPMTTITKPCDLSSSEFSFFSNHPLQIKDCIQRSELYADGYFHYTYVLDDNGNVWGTKYGNSANNAINTMLCLLSLGLLLGIAGALLITSPKDKQIPPN